jgi:hypothetical protein
LKCSRVTLLPDLNLDHIISHNQGRWLADISLIPKPQYEAKPANRSNPRKRHSEILTGIRIRKFEGFEMETKLKRKQEVLKKWKQKKIWPNSKPKKTKRMCKRRIQFE